MSQVYKDTCLVELVPHNAKQKVANFNKTTDSDDSVFSSSGILINPVHGYVITHGSVLLTHLSKNNRLLKRLLKIGHIPGKTFQDLTGLVTVDPVKNSQQSMINPGLKTSINSLFNSTSSTYSNSKCDQFPGHIELVWKANNFANAVQSFLPSSDQWSFFEEPDQNSSKDPIDPSLVANLLPYFVLIKLENWTNTSGNENTNLFDGRLGIGDTVHAVGTPFASMSPSVFLNSVSQGVICNVAGKCQELIVTDARCIPGSEGGTLYYGAANKKSYLFGIVASALCWKANEWIGLSLACHIGEVIHSLSEIFQLPEISSSLQIIQQKTDSHNKAKVGPASHPVVLVTVGNTWGSGLIIDQDAGIVLTCGHVIKNSKYLSVKVRVDHPTKTWFEADVLHATPVDHVFDIGVLRIREYNPTNVRDNRITIATDIEEGAESYVIGHAMFGHQHDLPPSVTSGVVSKVVSSHGAPVIVQSTCTVNAGASGGPLVTADGKVIGIVTCNARDTGTGASYPHVNLSVPLVTIWPLLLKLLDNGDLSGLKYLQIKNKQIKELWAMQGSMQMLKDLKSNL